MPGVPMEMPSETVMVLNSTLLPPAASMPAQASRASSPMCMLQGVTLAQVEATPICGLTKSSSWKPTARSIARAGACCAPSVTTREWARGSATLLLGDIRTSRKRHLHSLKAQCTERRQAQRQQQRKLPAAPSPPLEPHVYEHPDRWRHTAAHAGERHVHAHVVLRAAGGGKVVVAEVPAEISTGLRSAEQYGTEPQERRQSTEHAQAPCRRRQHHRPAPARTVAHHVRAIEQPCPPRRKIG